MTDAVSSVQSRIAQIEALTSNKPAVKTTEDSGTKMQDLLTQLAELNTQSAQSTGASSSVLGLDDGDTTGSTGSATDMSSLLSTLASAASQAAGQTTPNDNAALKAKAALLYGGNA